RERERVPGVCDARASPGVRRPGHSSRRRGRVLLRQPGVPGKTGQRVGHFVSRGGMDIEGVGWALVTQLQEKGLIGDPADLFFLKKEQLVELDRFAEKSASNIYERIQAAKRRPLSRILIGLGSRHVGGPTADDLARWLADRLPKDADLSAALEVLRSVS